MCERPGLDSIVVVERGLAPGGQSDFPDGMLLVEQKVTRCYCPPAVPALRQRVCLDGKLFDCESRRDVAYRARRAWLEILGVVFLGDDSRKIIGLLTPPGLNSWG
jgi:hypothetical protein